MAIRKPNFSLADKTALVDLVEIYAEILEDKKKDSANQQKKKQTWFQLALDYNQDGRVMRLDEELINCWTSLKKKAREYCGLLKQDNYGTGGGKKKTTPDPLLERVAAIIGISASGHETIYDRDGPITHTGDILNDTDEGCHPLDVFEVSHSSKGNIKAGKKRQKTSQSSSQKVHAGNPNQFTQSSSDEIDSALAEFFMGCNVPFNVVESKLFRRFLKTLNPSYQPPSRKRLSGSLLNQIYEKMNEGCRRVQEIDGVLIIDGWTNSTANTKNVVCTIRTNNGKNIFLHSWDFSGISETGEELANVINEAAKIAKQKFNIHIYAVISDNASAMKKAGGLIKFWHATCHSHSTNLLLKSLVDKTFAESINKLLREFKTAKGERELLKRGGKRIMLACETRWCSYRNTFRCCLKNLSIMRQITEEKIINPKEENLKLLNDTSLESKLLDAIILFDPICEMVNNCQKDDTSIADATEMWLNVVIPTDDANLDGVLQARLEKVLQPVRLAANLLHPQHQGKRFAPLGSLYSQALNFVEKELVNQPSELQGLSEYLKKEGVFQLLFAKSLMSSTFWYMAAEHYPVLAQLAIRLLNIPSSSAQIERLFSNWSFVHSDLRNRLTAQKSMKLVSIYYSLKMQD